MKNVRPLKPQTGHLQEQLLLASEAVTRSLHLLRRPVYPWSPDQQDLVERLVKLAPDSDPKVLAAQIEHIFDIIRTGAEDRDVSN
jgi:hypothetical protein